MEINSTIILYSCILWRLDIENNPDMDLDDVLAIQERLMQNKQEYDDERYM